MYFFCFCFFFFFFNPTAPSEIYTLSLHDALPIFDGTRCPSRTTPADTRRTCNRASTPRSSHGCTSDRKSTRLNSSHGYISYAVFCLKKKKKTKKKKHKKNKIKHHTTNRIRNMIRH